MAPLSENMAPKRAKLKRVLSIFILTRKKPKLKTFAENINDKYYITNNNLSYKFKKAFGTNWVQTINWG